MSNAFQRIKIHGGLIVIQPKYRCGPALQFVGIQHYIHILTHSLSGVLRTEGFDISRKKAQYDQHRDINAEGE
jgi:hypothetical protein